jgi:hypothetical protein
MIYTKVFNKNRILVLSLLCFLNDNLFASSQNILASNPFLTSQAESLKNEILKEKALKIYFSGNLAGSKESCGCALNPKGGFERRYNFLKKEGLLEKEIQENTLVLDFGNLLFKNENISTYEHKSALDNAQKMLQATNFFRYDAINFGNLDRSLSQNELQKIFGNSRFPWISSNLFPSSRFANTFKRSITRKLQNHDVLILGLSSAKKEELPQGWQIENAQSVLLNELKNIPASTLPIVLSDLEIGELSSIANTVKRPIIFLGSREMGGWDRPLEIGQSLLVHLRHQGQEWGILKVSGKWQDKQGWYNTSETPLLAQRWEELKKESLKIKELENSPEKNLEIKNLESKAEELKKLAPLKQRDISFSYETVEMNASFDGKNSVSRFMK